MPDVITRNATLLLGLLLTGAICLFAADWTVNGRGAYSPVLLDTTSPLMAIIVTLICFAAATAVAIVAARLTNPCVALFILGGGAFALDHRLATYQELIWSDATGYVAWETLLWSVVVLVAAIAVFRFGGDMDDVEPISDAHGADRAPNRFTSRDALICAAAGAVVVPIVWLLGQSFMKGQMLGAIFLGGMVAGLIGRLMSPHVQPVLLFAAPIFFGAIGQFIGRLTMRDAPLDAMIDNALPALLIATPLDYVAGSLCGVAVGLGWAKSFLESEEEPVS